MNSTELKIRTKQFAIDVIRFVDSQPSSKTFEILGRQLIRSASSVGANYRSACRARSRADFISKISIVEEEADECQYWLELFLELVKNKSSNIIEPLLKEAGELTAIFTATGRTTRLKK
jgi:four helix bundle protein